MRSRKKLVDIKRGKVGEESLAYWLWGVKGVVKFKVRIECHALSVNHRTEEY